MATLTIRNIDDETKAKLRLRAARNGRSMEAEVRNLLRVALDAADHQQQGLGSRIRQRFIPLGGVELEEPE